MLKFMEFIKTADLVQIVLQVGQQTDVERGNTLFIHYILAFEEGST